MHFFASRLNYSRWVEVTIVPDERTETLVRTWVDYFAVIIAVIFGNPAGGAGDDAAEPCFAEQRVTRCE